MLIIMNYELGRHVLVALLLSIKRFQAICYNFFKKFERPQSLYTKYFG